jgi:hypothetical protein
MLFSTEQHFAAAKLVRAKASRLVGTDLNCTIKMSNALIICAQLAAAERGDICLTHFDWLSAEPDWQVIEDQITGLKPLEMASPPLIPSLSP